jgi:hypothetical protein
MSSKIDIRRIVTAHLRTLYNYGTERASVSDYFWHFIIPLGLGFFIASRIALSQSTISILINVYSVLIGLLLAVIAILFTFLDKLEYSRRRIARKEDRAVRDFDSIKWRERLIKEVFANISFTIFISLFSIVLLIFLYNWKLITPLLSFLSDRAAENILYIGNSFAWADAFIHGVLVLMILKRMHILFFAEIEAIEKIDMNEF